jgi:hypothetical protein
MLPPFIIDQIRKREEEESRRRDEDQPRLELPNPSDAYRGRVPHASDRSSDEGDDPNRGVMIVQL